MEIVTRWIRGTTLVWCVAGLVALGQAQEAKTLASDHDELHGESIQRALGERITLSITDVSLKELVAQWREKFNINIMVDVRRLEEEGLAADEVRFHAELSDIRFSSALKILLDAYDLAYIPRADHLLITTPVHVESELLPKVYPVQDLVLAIRGGRVEQDFDSLIETVSAAISPESWETYGGPASIKTVPTAGVLVISQSHEAHRRIAELFATIREARVEQGIVALPSNLQPAASEDASKKGFLPGTLPVVGSGQYPVQPR
jgi:hypothetical protein